MLDWTGERFLPFISPETIGAEIHYEHLHRYAFASQFVKNKNVLDLGCGEGYGSFLLSQSANQIIGVEIDHETVTHATHTYNQKNLQFIKGDILNLPIKNEKIFDVIVCFEAIEHIEKHEQLLYEIERVLKDDGFLIISTPNTIIYNDDPSYSNPYHVHELNFFEFKQLLKSAFFNVSFYGQKVTLGSHIWNLPTNSDIKTHNFALKRGGDKYFFTDEENSPKYYIAIASKEKVPESININSFCVDISESILEQKNEEIQRMVKDIDILQNINLENQEKINIITNPQFFQLFKLYDASLSNIFPPYSYRRQLLDTIFHKLMSSVAKPRYQKGDDDGSSFVSCNKSYQYDIICFPIIHWDFRYQRPQHILSRFANAGCRIFYLNYQHSKEKKSYVIKVIQKDIYEVILYTNKRWNIFSDPFSPKIIHSFINSIITLCSNLNINSPILFVEFPKWEPIATHIKNEIKSKIVYDCLDEYSDFSNIDHSIIQKEINLLQNCDLVVTTSKYLFNKVIKHNHNTILIPNAGDFEHFHNLSTNCKLNYIHKPIIGYFGAIAEWFDIELIIHIARDRPDWNLVLIGNTDGCSIKKAEKLPNVYFLGEKKYTDLPDFLYWFDVCLIPFKLTELIKATHPVKFYEYLSTGKPVVSAKLPELLQYNHLCYFYENKDEAINVISQALHENDEKLREKRIQFAQENTWDNRVETYLTHIHELYQIEGN